TGGLSSPSLSAARCSSPTVNGCTSALAGMAAACSAGAGVSAGWPQAAAPIRAARVRAAEARRKVGVIFVPPEKKTPRRSGGALSSSALGGGVELVDLVPVHHRPERLQI